MENKNNYIENIKQSNLAKQIDDLKSIYGVTSIEELSNQIEAQNLQAKMKELFTEEQIVESPEVVANTMNEIRNLKKIINEKTFIAERNKNATTKMWATKKGTSFTDMEELLKSIEEDGVNLDRITEVNLEELIDLRLGNKDKALVERTKELEAAQEKIKELENLSKTAASINNESHSNERIEQEEHQESKLEKVELLDLIFMFSEMDSLKTRFQNEDKLSNTEKKTEIKLIFENKFNNLLRILKANNSDLDFENIYNNYDSLTTELKALIAKEGK